MTALATTAVRTAALEGLERKPCTVLEMGIDTCTNTYGVAPCTAAAATGGECYNTYYTCQDKPNYAKATKILRFTNRGVMSPKEGLVDMYASGDYFAEDYNFGSATSLRPYILGVANAPVTIDIEAGLASRSNISLSLADETDDDAGQDPYFATRLNAPRGTYWARWLARNKNFFGRVAKLRKGFVASPWDWDLFLDELYIIDNIAQESNGLVKVTLKDPIKLADNNTVPLPTSGAITAAMLAYENTGVAQTGSTSTSIKLAAEASAVDSAYVGMEVYVYANTGAGQRRVITAYVGSTRVATVAAWSVTPDNTSAYQVSALSVTVDSGKGAQYTDPATSGKNEYIRINGEIIRYTALTGDVLSWPDATYRAQFGSTRSDHAANDAVQLCRAFIDRTVADVITDLFTESGIDAAYIGTTIASETSAWYGASFNITACISAPESASDLIAEILKQIAAVAWWSPQSQKIEMKAVMPESGSTLIWDDEATIIQGSMNVKILDSLRVTQSAISYDIRDATGNLSEPRSFKRTDLVVNANAQSVNEYGDTRPQVETSRWFGSANSSAVVAVVNRKVNRLYHAPKLFSFKIDPKDYTLQLGSYVTINTFKHVDAAGAPKNELCIITKVSDVGTHIEIEARATNFTGRYGYIAPNGTADYPTDTTYAHISQNTGLMTNGDEAYSIS